jgi:hypothetical protein
MKQLLLQNWHLMRWIRLIIGLGLIIQGFWMFDWIAGIIGGLFLVQAISNTGCCGSAGCALPSGSEPKK